MKKKIIPVVSIAALSSFLLPLALANPFEMIPTFAEEAPVQDKVILRIMNMEDYIYFCLLLYPINALTCNRCQKDMI